MKQFLLASVAVAMWLGVNSQTVSDTFNYTGAVQNFTVPPCVTSVTIVTKGAQGGAVTGYSPFPQGGLGATMQGDFAVTPASVLTVVVGGRGNPDPSSSGGGGGSGVNDGNTALIVAGGGAGVDFQDPNFAGQHAVTANSGVTGNGSGGAGGTGGGDGGDNIYSGSHISRGGRGWNAGASGSTGLNGVSASTTTTNGTWGLGGGGGSVGYGWCNCGGGGGGYSGGGSGQINQTGGGGGSYNIGTNQVNTPGNNTGNGMVIITYTPGAGIPASPAGITGTSTVCEGSAPLTYFISPVGGATGYTWSVTGNSSIISGQGTTSIDVQPGTGGSTISVTADNACGSSAPTTFVLTIQPAPIVALGADTTQCGGTVTLDANNVGSTYMWSDMSTNQTLVVSASGAYSVSVTDGNGCFASDTVNVTINALPTVNAVAPSMVCLDDGSMTLTSSTPAGGTWSGPGMSGNTFTPMTAGAGSHQLTYTYTDSLGCTNFDTTTVTVDLCLGVNSAGAAVFGITPNPNNGSFVVEFNFASEKAIIEVVDVTGKVVQSTQVNSVASGSRATIHCNEQSNGVYFIRVTANGESTMKKMMIVK
jgi:hypothetical protein